MIYLSLLLRPLLVSLFEIWAPSKAARLIEKMHKYRLHYRPQWLKKGDDSG